MTAPSKFDPRSIVQTLRDHDVRFVIIGGYACEIHGVDHSTIDIDIIIDASESNAEALLAALEAMGAIHARLPGSHQVIRPTLTRILTTTGDLHDDTRYGRLDVSKESGGHTYTSLMADQVVVAGRGGHEITVAELRMVADMKTKAGREKDKRALPAIQRRLQELNSEVE